MPVSTVHILEADLSRADHAAAVLDLIDQYARTPYGQSRPLDESIRCRLIGELQSHPTARIFLAQSGEAYVGIAVCFGGFSTFAARPLLNIHDIFVRDDQQGRSVGRQLLQAVEQAAIAAGCCKLTLEVMDANPKAMAVYQRCGFDLGTIGGDAHRFMSKRLAGA